MTSQMIQTVTNRINEMLQNSEINNVYQSFNSEEEAKNWITKTAIATLIIPVEKR